jgi:hypothetical protein
LWHPGAEPICRAMRLLQGERGEGRTGADARHLHRTGGRRLSPLRGQDGGKRRDKATETKYNSPEGPVGLVIREHCDTEGVARGGRDGAGGKRERFPEERTCVPHRRGPRAIGVGARGYWMGGGGEACAPPAAVLVG